jgi:hypothetical protein
MARQMTFAEIGAFYNTISDELEGGVTHQNMRSLARSAAFPLRRPLF